MAVKWELEQREGCIVAVATGNECVIADTQDALDLAMGAVYEQDTNLIAMDKTLVSENFFDLRTGLAGSILQKFVDYQIKVAIFGDFSDYASEALKALMRESNRGRDVFFVATREEAVRRLAAIGA